MANIQITQLPTAGAITGAELVPIVQNGTTVQTTTGAISASPSQTQSFITVNQELTLPNSRYLSTGTGLGLTNGGTNSYLRIALNGASGSLESASSGIIVKNGGSSVVARSIAASGNGLSVSNANGTGGNPTLALSGLTQALADYSGTGFMAVVSGSTLTGRQFYGTTNQVIVANGNGSSDPVIAIASNPVIPGTGGVVVPAGTTGQRGTSTLGNFRYNSTTGLFEGYNGAWTAFASGSGVTSIATGTGLTGGPITSTGTISIADTTVVAASYTNANITVNAQGQITSATNGTAGTVTSVAMSVPAFLSVAGSPITSSGTLAVTLSGTALPIANGGTGQTTASAAFNALSPMTTAGDTIYGGTSGAGTRLGIGTVGQILTVNTGATAPEWSTLSGVAVTTFSGGTTGFTPSSATSGAVTLAGTLAVANGGTGLTFGTSGGILVYTATGTLASSALLAANALMIGGGVGVAPSTTTTGTGVVTALGVNTGTAGAFVVNGGALGTPSSGTVTNLTGTASININGTVGATTTNTGAFTTVTATTGIFGGTF